MFENYRKGRRGLKSGLSRLRDGAKADSGATAIEFAIVGPMVLALMFGVMEGGRVMFTQGVLSYATQAATRWAVVNPPASGQTPAQYNAQIEDYAKSKLILISPNQVSTVTVTSPTNPADNTRTITVTVSYNFDWMLPYVSEAAGTFALSASSSGFLAENF